MFLSSRKIWEENVFASENDATCYFDNWDGSICYQYSCRIVAKTIHLEGIFKVFIIYLKWVIDMHSGGGASLLNMFNYALRKYLLSVLY
jgi:hypothetical protein